MAVLSTIFNFEHPAFEFYLYYLAQGISIASRRSILLGCIYHHGPSLIQWLLADRLTPGYIHIAQIGVKLVALAEFLASPVRLSLSPINQTPQLCPAKRPFLHQYIEGVLRFTITGASFFISKLLYKPLRALHPYAPAITAALFVTYDIWRPFIRLMSMEESFVKVFCRCCLDPVRQSLYERRSQLSSSFLVVGSNAPLFEYPQLSTGNMIRLLKLQVEEATPSRVACELLAVNIDTAPPYDAISYVWGNPERKHSLLVGDTVKQYIPITASARNVLRAVTPFYGTHYLWIDSICINQRDKAEKDRQIPLMKNIYGRATEVILSIEEPSTAATAVSFLNRFYWHYMVKDPNLLTTTFNKDGDLRTGFTVDLPFLEEAQTWEAWRGFVNNNYWTRVWIIQECAVAKDITVIYGGVPLAWDIVHLSTLVMRSTVSYMQNHSAQTAYDSLDRIRLILSQRFHFLRNGPTQPLVELVVDFRDSFATDPADKVNALLGLSQDSGVLAIQPDSKRSVKEVYANLVRLAFQTGSFYSFSMSGLSNRQGGNGLSELPSWIPDLTRSQTLDTSRYHGRNYTAGASTPVEFEISTQWDQLRLKGVFVDTILASSLHSDIPEIVKLALEGAGHPDGLRLGRDFLGRLIEMLEFFELYLPKVQDQYNESDPRECFWQTITDDFDGKQFSKRDELTQILEDLEKFVDELKKENLQPLQEGDKFSSQEFRSLLSSRWAAESFWPKNDHSEIFRLISRAITIGAIAISEMGFIALAPLGAKAEDVIVVFQGSPIPHILRPTGKHDASYFLWGEAYVHGIMYGKAMDVEKTCVNQLANRLTGIPGISSRVIQSTGATKLLNFIPAEYHAAALEAYNDSLRVCFQVGLIMACLSTLGALGMEWRSVKKNFSPKNPDGERAAEEGKGQGDLSEKEAPETKAEEVAVAAADGEKDKDRDAAAVVFTVSTKATRTASQIDVAHTSTLATVKKTKQKIGERIVTEKAEAKEMAA